MKIKIFSTLVIISIIIILLTSIIASYNPSIGIKFTDWMYILPMLLITFILSMILLLNKQKIYLIYGGAIGGGIGTVLLSISILFQYQLITSDGTAWWALVMLPIFWIGYPLLIIGGIIGIVYSWVKKRKSRNSQNQLPPPTQGF